MPDELGDIVQGKPWFGITEIAGPYLKGPPPRSDPPVFQPPAQHLVDDLAEGPARPLRFRLELGCHLVVEGQCRAYDLTLWLRNHDVKGG